MNVTGAGWSPSMRIDAPQRGMAAGGVNARQQAENDTAGRMLPLRAAEVAARAATEARGMFVDTYA